MYLTACGGGETGGSTPYDGKWIAVSAEGTWDADECGKHLKMVTFEVNGSEKGKNFLLMVKKEREHGKKKTVSLF